MTDRLRAAAQRALESLNALIADTFDPGVEALGARHELGQALLNTAPAVAPTAPPAADEPADRRARYAEAVNTIVGYPSAVMVDAVMAVADAEQAELRTEMERRTLMLQASRDEVERLRADRATVLRKLADEQTQRAVADDLARRRDMAAARRQIVKDLRRLADEAQQPETEAHPAQTEWIGEVLELDGTWEYLGASPDRAVAEKRRTSVTRRHPDAQTRTVRKVTTYTVAAAVQPAPAPTEEPTR